MDGSISKRERRKRSSQATQLDQCPLHLLYRFGPKVRKTPWLTADLVVKLLDGHGDIIAAKCIECQISPSLFEIEFERATSKTKLVVHFKRLGFSLAAEGN